MKDVAEPQSKDDLESLTPDGAILLQAKRDMDSANMAIAGIGNLYRILMNSCLTLGDHEGALNAANQIGHTEYAQSIIDAVERDDNERCDCEHSIEVSITPNRTETATAPHYLLAIGHPIWSDKHDEMVSVYRCFKCNHMNAIPGHIDGIHQKAHDARVDHAYTVNAQASSNGGKFQLSDHMKDGKILSILK